MGTQHNSPDESGVSEKGPMLNVTKEIEQSPPDRNSDEGEADTSLESNPPNSDVPSTQVSLEQSKLVTKPGDSETSEKEPQTTESELPAKEIPATKSLEKPSPDTEHSSSKNAKAPAAQDVTPSVTNKQHNTETQSKVIASPESETLLSKDFILDQFIDGKEPPKDYFNLVYIIFYLLGLATLLPWNFFITAVGYWSYKFRNATLDESPPDVSYKTELQTSFFSYLSVASMVPNTVFLMLNTIFGHKFSQTIRLVVPLIVVSILFGVTVVLVKVDTDSWQYEFFAITIVTVVLLNCNTAVFQGALFGLAGSFPVSCTQAVVNGQALGGIFACVASVISLAAGSSDVDSALLYFLTALMAMILAIVAYFHLRNLEYYKFYAESKTDGDVCMGEIPETKKDTGSVDLKTVFLKIYKFAISVALVLFTTLAIFPGVVANVKPMYEGQGYPWSDIYFKPVACFLLYNVGDFFGRTSACYSPWPTEKGVMLPLLCFLRIGIIILLMFCNIIPRGPSWPVVFSHDAWFIVYMAILAITNGFLISKCMMFGPKQVEEESQQTAGAMMAFFLGLGLMLGAMTSYGLVALLQL